MHWLHPFVNCSCSFSSSMCDKAYSGVHLFFLFFCVRVFTADGESRPLSPGSSQWIAGRTKTKLLNKTLFVLHSVGESATAELVWHLYRLIIGVKAVLGDHLSLWAAHLSCCGPGAGSQAWTVSGNPERLSCAHDLQSCTVQRCELSSVFMRLKRHTWGRSDAIVWMTFIQD